MIALGVVLRLNEVKRAPRWHAWDTSTVQRDLPEVMEDTLRVLVLSDPLIWEERPKATSGLEYDLLKRFARKTKLKMTVIRVEHPDSLMRALWRGVGDVGAMQVVAHPEWHGHFATTLPYAAVKPVIARQREEVVQEKAGFAFVSDSNLVALASPFADRAYEWDRSLHVRCAASFITEDQALIDVVLGRSKSAIISDLRAGHEAERFPVIEYSEPLGPARDLCFMVRTSSPQLLKALNTSLADEGEVNARELIVRSYTGTIPKAGPLRSLRAKGLRRDSISPFDAEFRKHAGARGWDWRLLAAMAWKETRFDSTVTSRKGAMGIMQFMPGTAARMGLDSASTMEEHIRAAARYMSRLDTLWMRAVPDKQQRSRFVLASYNAGPGHIIDAQRLADQLGLDPARWEGNVERAVLLLAKPQFYLRPEMKNGYCKGSQVFHYVRGVLTVYDQLKGKTN